MKESFTKKEEALTPVQLINGLIKQWHPDRHIDVNDKVYEVITQFVDVLVTIRAFSKEYGVQSLEQWGDIDEGTGTRDIQVPTFDEDGTYKITKKTYLSPKDFLTDIHVLSNTQSDRAAELRALRQSRMPHQPVKPTESKSPSPFAKRDKKSNIFD